MTVQTINIGNQVNDGLGDDLRSAFQKVNANFSELNSQISVIAVNVGTSTGVGIFKEKSGATLRFKSLVSDGKITINPQNDTITIGTTQKDAFSSITTNNGVVVADVGTNYDNLTLQGGSNVIITAAQRTITVDTRQDFGRILVTDADFGNLNGITDNLFTLVLQNTDIDFGSFTNPAPIEYDAGTL
jgi:hypothetical protein